GAPGLERLVAHLLRRRRARDLLRREDRRAGGGGQREQGGEARRAGHFDGPESSRAAWSKKAMHFATLRSTSAPAPVSYSALIRPWNPWRFSSARMPRASLLPVPQGTSTASGLPNSPRSLKWSSMTRPSSFFRQSTGLSPPRVQWPVSEQE